MMLRPTDRDVYVHLLLSSMPMWSPVVPIHNIHWNWMVDFIFSAPDTSQREPNKIH